MASWGKPVRTKIVIDDNVLEHISYFKYIDIGISYKKDKDIEKKLNKQIVLPVDNKSPIKE